MNRTIRLSLIAVMLLATFMLGILGWNAMYPSLPPPSEPPGPSHPPPQPVEIPEPRLNPEYEKLQADLEAHERRCLQLVKQATILLPSQSQNPAEQRVKECRNLVEIEREYVKNFPAKTIQ
jgi:hypothetical protein